MPTMYPMPAKLLRALADEEACAVPHTDRSVPLTWTGDDAAAFRVLLRILPPDARHPAPGRHVHYALMWGDGLTLALNTVPKYLDMLCNLLSTDDYAGPLGALLCREAHVQRIRVSAFGTLMPAAGTPLATLIEAARTEVNLG